MATRKHTALRTRLGALLEAWNRATLSTWGKSAEVLERGLPRVPPRALLDDQLVMGPRRHW
jgi:hypothetical protein